ncbi:CCN family member 2-like isoform X1 [Salvelinus namaycush]|uniref:CCN family member 2-like isoform X1 n=1 Tax=Salvelinus namaycush TaxID=8040 RepID=A0A8U1C1R1_SALNM|nr:CCN family member 2-like isoform X1 [Salvelinus namaycush]
MEISRQLSDNVIALALLLCMGALQVWCQLCLGPCQCPSPVPLCPAGVPLVLDGCQCCQVCARQQGEACSDLYVCDSQRGLQCDYSTSFPGDPGACSSQEELGCEMNGVSYLDGQVFQPSCATQCRCLGGGVTCVPLCPEDIRLPSPDCPHPQRVQLPGKCCKEWVCENTDNTILQDAITASRSDRLWPGMSGPQQNPAFNCIDQSTEWSVCSRTCDAGVSTRVSNKNPACRLEMQSRLCKVWPCQALQPRRSPMSGRRCEPSYRSVVPVRLVHQGCYSTRVYRPRYCGQCTDARCCTPYRTSTATVAFRCPTGRLLHRAVMMIQSCVCHYNCPYSASGPYAAVPYSASGPYAAVPYSASGPYAAVPYTGPSRSYRSPAIWG